MRLGVVAEAAGGDDRHSPADDSHGCPSQLVTLVRSKVEHLAG
jgi:hypothetical protein